MKPKWNNERQPVHSTPKGTQPVLKNRVVPACLRSLLTLTVGIIAIKFAFNTFSTLVDAVANHVKPYWPAEATTASDSEDLGGAERLRVETKVNVELHQENKLNHTGERERDAQQERDKQTSGSARDTAPPNQHNSNSSHPPEQRKGKLDSFWVGGGVNKDKSNDRVSQIFSLRYPEEQD